MLSVLVDTNVLVHAVDPSVPAKQRRAIEELERLVNAGSGVLSVQCLSEYFSVVTRKLSPPLTIEQARSNLESFCRIWRVVPVTVAVVLEAVRAVSDYKMSFWDAQIWAVAKLSGASEVLSEDFSHGQIIEGVKFRNPFVSP